MSTLCSFLYVGGTDVTLPSVSLNCVKEVIIPCWSLLPTYHLWVFWFLCGRKKNSFKKVPSIYKGKMYALQNSNGEGSEQCYMLLIFLLLTLATLIMQAK